MALPKNQGKPHRALARELNVSEGTIRRDRRVLAHLEPDRCNLRARPVPPTIVEPYDWKSPWYLKCILKAGRRWVWNEDVRPAEWKRINPWIRNCLLHACSGEPATVDPAMALENLRPKDLNPEDLHAYSVWLMNWLEYCLPGDRFAQQRMLEKIGERVEARRYPMKRSRVTPIAQIRHLSFW